MEQEYLELNVDGILEEIRSDISKRGLRGELPPFSDFSTFSMEPLSLSRRLDLKELNRDVLEMSRICEIDLDAPLTAKRRFLAPLEFFFKSILRKLLRFVLWPIVTEQNFFNKLTVYSMNQTRNYIMETAEKDYEKEIRELKEQIRNLEERLQAAENAGKDSV